MSLVEAAHEGDDMALAELVRRTQPVVWRLCASLGSGDDVDDLVQETYLRAIRSLGSFRGESPVLPWLITIGRRTCADHVRRRQRERRLIDRIERVSAPQTEPAPPLPVDDLLDHLDEDRRAAFALTQLMGLSYEEAGQVLGCPIGTVRSRVSRARADLLALVSTDEATAPRAPGRILRSANRPLRSA